jgi:hypothetical protein
MVRLEVSSVIGLAHITRPSHGSLGDHAHVRRPPPDAPTSLGGKGHDPGVSAPVDKHSTNALDDGQQCPLEEHRAGTCLGRLKATGSADEYYHRGAYGQAGRC